MDIDGKAQGGGGNYWTINGVVDMVRRPGKVTVPVQSREDISFHGLWKRGSTTMFGIRIVNLDAGSYLRMTPKKDF